MTIWNEVKVTKSVFLPKLQSHKFIHISLTGLGDLAETIIILLKYGSLSPNVTLKNRSRSYKLNELLIVYIHISKNTSPSEEETWHTDECYANVNADVNGIHTKIYLFLLLRGEGNKKYMPTYDTEQSIFCVNKKLHLPLVWSKSPNFSRKSTDLVQHPTWINPEVTWLSMSWLI